MPWWCATAVCHECPKAGQNLSLYLGAVLALENAPAQRVLGLAVSCAARAGLVVVVVLVAVIVVVVIVAGPSCRKWWCEHECPVLG